MKNIPAVTCESAYFKPCSMFNANGSKIISDGDNTDKSKEVNFEAFNLLEPKIELEIEETKSDWKPNIKPEFDFAKGGYVCKICFKCLKSSRILKMHTRNMPSNRDRVKCQLCDKTFSSTSCLKRHLQTRDEIGKSHYCD